MSDIAIHLKNAAGFGRKIEKAWLVVVAIFIGLAIFVPLQAEASFAFVAEALTGMAPFLALAIGVAAYARASGADNLIAKAFQGRMSIMIVFAALFGGMSPFCSCGVIPLIAALLAMGVPVPAVMAFWLASPLMDPTMFVLTAGTLSLDFAIAKTLAADRAIDNHARKTLTKRFYGEPALCIDRMDRRIGIVNWDAAIREHGRGGAFSHADRAGEAEDDHAFCSSDVRQAVSATSMSGRTPSNQIEKLSAA